MSDNDGVVLDSEDEQEYGRPLELKPLAAPPATGANLAGNAPKAVIEPSKPTGDKPKPSTSTSTISTATTAPPPARPRPKPKPIRKPLTSEASSIQAPSFSTSASTISNPTTIGAGLSSNAHNTSIPGLNASTSLDFLSGASTTIADRAKTRARNAARTQNALFAGEIIDLSDDSADELDTLPPKKPAQTKSSANKSTPSSKSLASNQLLTSNKSLASNKSTVAPKRRTPPQPQLPQGTSSSSRLDLNPTPAGRSSPSWVSTEPLTSQPPPIETLPPPPATGMSGAPATGPSGAPATGSSGALATGTSGSQASASSIGKRRRAEVDELAGEGTQSDVGPPPPTFFAAPTPPDPEGAGTERVATPSSAKGKDVTQPAVEGGPAPAVRGGPRPAIEGSPPPKKKSRKKAQDDDDDDDFEIFIEEPPKKKSRKKAQDSDDEDFEASEAKKKKPRARKSKAGEKGTAGEKGKAAEKAKAGDKEKLTKEKPAKKALAKAKGKGKAKVVEEHISADMIEDSGDELGAGMKLGGAPPPVDEPSRSPPSASSSKSVEQDGPAVPKPNANRNSKKRDADAAHINDKELSDLTDDEGPVVVIKRAPHQRKKPRIDSDDEDAGANNAAAMPAPDDPPHEEHAPPAKGRKGKARATGNKKGRKKAASPPPEDAPDPEVGGDEPPGQEENLPKENVGPVFDGEEQKGLPRTRETTPEPPPRAVSPSASPPRLMETPKAKAQPTTLTARYSIAPRTKSTPMSELIKRVNSQSGSPFPSRSSFGGTAYSPYLKASKRTLSKIAPLHPNRRTPPPPLPPPPPRKKTKKELEREEKWEEELIEEHGGVTEWACMSDMERKEARRIKREREMAGWED
ncbi:uncharacterized protein SCHCODRAFT_02643028 [Schizophyllum commune H4-8]|uniref:uncharacterized protein n=1 Tax=Schizophyllum commune (strain H4-8 / FGSC 9210) TaxID=578458 RepID=UPI00215FE732|nr:uncharacterized protein SCHCODRAFT_02643028 [Schizophyllum commune H4-8]KAI5886009.1 hypothetical protein SCHCODRAFT_02643028 [Schizophyllum commune H4-8]